MVLIFAYKSCFYYTGLNELVALDETGTRVADFEVLDLVDADDELFQVTDLPN
jgi:hypothetical protein